MSEYWPDFHVFNKNIFSLIKQYAGKSCFHRFYLHISHDISLTNIFHYTTPDKPHNNLLKPYYICRKFPILIHSKNFFDRAYLIRL